MKTIDKIRANKTKTLVIPNVWHDLLLQWIITEVKTKRKKSEAKRNNHGKHLWSIQHVDPACYGQNGSYPHSHIDWFRKIQFGLWVRGKRVTSDNYFIISVPLKSSGKSLFFFFALSLSPCQKQNTMTFTKTDGKWSVMFWGTNKSHNH